MNQCTVNIFNRKNPQNSESPNGPRKGLDFIDLVLLWHDYIVKFHRKEDVPFKNAKRGSKMLLYELPTRPCIQISSNI